MISRITLAAAIAAVGLSLSGCAGGDRVAATPTQPGSPTPVASAAQADKRCHTDRYTQQIERADGDLVDCAESHLAETVFIGRFETSAARAPVVEEVIGSEAVSGPAAALQDTAYRECGTRAEAYLGHSWIHPLVRLRLAIPSDAAWAAGGRWYRCDLYEVSWGTKAALRRVSSFTAAWPDAVCAVAEATRMAEKPCAEKHSAEYTGGIVLKAGERSAFAFAHSDYEPYLDECTAVIAAYMGTTTAKARKQTGVRLLWQDDPLAGWATNRVLMCFTWTGADPADAVTGSVKAGRG